MENAGRGGICGLACDVCKGVGMANTLGSLIFGVCGVTASDGSASGLGEEPLSVAKGRSNVVIQLVRMEKRDLLSWDSFENIATLIAVVSVFGPLSSLDVRSCVYEHSLRESMKPDFRRYPPYKTCCISGFKLRR